MARKPPGQQAEPGLVSRLGTPVLELWSPGAVRTQDGAWRCARGLMWGALRLNSVAIQQLGGPWVLSQRSLRPQRALLATSSPAWAPHAGMTCHSHRHRVTRA